MPLPITRGAASAKGFGFTSGGGALYPFTTFTFTSAGIDGRNGPSLATLQSAYSATSWTQNTAFFSQQLTGVQTWTVPVTGNYQFLVVGSSSPLQVNGSLAGQDSGAGIKINATINLVQGQKLNLIVGQMGRIAGGGYEVGGGGASVVMSADIPFNLLATSDLYVVAGGGAGCSQQYNSNSSLNGTYSFTNNTLSSTATAQGGPSGGTYYSAPYSGSGGGGLTTDGGNWTNNDGEIYGGYSLRNGFLGGYPANTPYGDGGFGGGGAARGNSYAGGGGGGGYTGGNGGAAGGGTACGGGSYVNPSKVSSYSNGGFGNSAVAGYITVTKL